jgi:hypothetical protein
MSGALFHFVGQEMGLDIGDTAETPADFRIY